MMTRTIKNTDLLPQRIPWTYPERIIVPAQYQKYLWDYPGDKAPLEIFILRLCLYGRFEDLQWLFHHYPHQSYTIVQRYPKIHRGVKFWIKHWYETNLR